MTQKDKELISQFCYENLHTHTDWTDTYVETQYKCESVGDFLNQFFNYIKVFNYIKEHE